MSGDVEPEHFAFQGELVLVVPFFVGDLDGEDRIAGGAVVGTAAEQVELTDRLSALGLQNRVDRLGVNQFDTQYWRANIDPNERYTLTVAGTLQHRLSPWQSGYDNLVLAGDWTYTGFNVGSFEGSVMSGKLASLTLSGAPSIAAIPGYDFLHPDPRVPPAPRIP